MTKSQLKQVVADHLGKSWFVRDVPVVRQFPIHIPGTFRRDMNVILCCSDPTPSYFSKYGFRTLIRLILELKVNGPAAFVPTATLNDERLVPAGRDRSAVYEIIESLAWSVGGDEAREVLDRVMLEPSRIEETFAAAMGWVKRERVTREKPKVARNGLPRFKVDSKVARIDPNASKGIPSVLKIANQFLGASFKKGWFSPDEVKEASEKLTKLGWRGDLVYIHNVSGTLRPPSNREGRGRDGRRLLVVPNGVTYDRAILLEHPDRVIRDLAALLPK